MTGPCLCGDPCCASCGSPGAAEAEAAEEWALEAMAKAKLTPEEYRIAVSVGLAAVAQARKAVKQVFATQAQNAAEEAAYREVRDESVLD